LLEKIISQRSAFAFRSPARALAAGLPRQDHVYKTTNESFRFHTKNINECVVNWIPLRIRVRSRNTQPHLKVVLGILQITSAKRCPQVWLWFDRSLFSTNFVEFDQAV